jgi:hypothetical protein
MLKKPLAVALVLSFCLLATPVLAQAGTWTNTPRTSSSTFFSEALAALTSWWGSFLGGAESEAPILAKNGCGIDPNGQPLCGPMTGAMPNGDPDPVGGPGSGN